MQLLEELLSLAANAICEQHEAEKKFLEDELNSKRKSRSKQSDLTKEGMSETTKTARENIPELTDNKTSDSTDAPAKPKTTVLKEVNILDDLEKEFSRLYGRGVLDYHSKQMQQKLHAGKVGGSCDGNECITYCLWVCNKSI